jgi:hypothetical protein
MRKIANVFLNGVEVSAQEASYGVLGIPLTNSSRDCVFIPTGPPEERIIFVKTENELRNLDSDSTDIGARGLLDHYVQRPDEIEEICLAEFAAWYTYSSRKSNRIDLEIEDVEEEVNNTECSDYQVELPKFMRLKDKSGFIRKRKVQRIIRFRRYGEKEDPENYCREQIMLYHPWRDEDIEISNIDHCERFHILHDQIRDLRNKFNSLELELTNHGFDSEDSSEEDEEDKEYAALGGYEGKGDVMQELFQDRDNGHVERIPVPLMISESLYHALIESLNSKQEQYLCHVIEILQKGRNLTEFVYGGAGKEENFIDANIRKYIILFNRCREVHTN